MKNELWKSYIRLIKREVIPALGCTEPVAVALAAARARKILGDDPERIEIFVSRNILKNAMGVGIPGTGMIGLEIAAALGALGGNPDLELEVLKAVREEDITKAQEMVSNRRVLVSFSEVPEILYICVNLFRGDCSSQVIIKDSHKNVVSEALNGEVLYNEEILHVEKDLDDTEEKTPLSIKLIFEFAQRAPISELEFIYEAVKLNTVISDEGLKNSYGLSLGRIIEKSIERGFYSHDLSTEAVKRTAAAIDARMAGSMLPVMSNSGSGNQGITATLPLVAIANMLHADKELLIRSLVLSHLTAIHIKSDLAKLSPVCGAIIAATGVSCGITYLLGGGFKNIEYAIFNMIGNISGMICDGAKSSCSLKVSASVSAAVHAAILALEKKRVTEEQGIVDDDVEKTIRNFGVIGTEGMVGTDKVILDIMISKERTCGKEPIT